MSNFHLIKAAVAKQFAAMTKNGATLFTTGVDRDTIWTSYLKAFPAGSNPIFKERTEHDCSCCKQFIRTVGDVVAMVNGELQSIWDVEVDDPAYQKVANKMAKLVKARSVKNVFIHDQQKVGADKTFDAAVNSSVSTWHHFFVNLPSSVVKRKDQIPTHKGERLTEHDLFERALEEFTLDALDTVLDLIGQNSLYRGQEHFNTVSRFRAFFVAYKAKKDALQKDLMIWHAITSGDCPAQVIRVRNTSIGTLLIDLSNEVELEQAVRKFEAMVAPTNYKRPTALVTPKMVEQAKETIGELGLTTALQRRLAVLDDLTINNVLFADRSAKPALGERDVFDDLATSAGKRAVAKRSMDKIEDISIDKFLQDVLPHAEQVEVMFESRHQGNLMTLVAPVDPTSGTMFKWDNRFSWDYNGNLADSIKEKVKQAGGNVTGDVCCRLAWFNYDDLDFHMKEPGGYEIYFGNRAYNSPAGGMLDVDMNAGHGVTREPVENIFYKHLHTMNSGTYSLVVHNYAKRETENVGFEVEIDVQGQVYNFAYNKAVRDREMVEVAKLVVKNNQVEVVPSLSASQTSRIIWGLATQQFHKVKLLCLSPNHWDDNQVGNKHWFFILDGAVNEGVVRPFFNEFLGAKLDKHRKVFEIVGSKLKIEPQGAEEQLSGLGFSSTKKDSLVVKVKGSFTRTLNILFQ